MTKPSIDDNIKGNIFLVAIAAITILVMALITVIPYGDNITVYDTVLIGEHYIKPDGFYYKGIVSTSQCGTLPERVFGSSVHEFKVSQDQFQKTFRTHRAQITYTCKKGQFENITWSD